MAWGNNRATAAINTAQRSIYDTVSKANTARDEVRKYDTTRPYTVGCNDLRAYKLSTILSGDTSMRVLRPFAISFTNKSSSP